MKPAPWMFAAPWGARGYVSDLDGPVHWIEFTPGDSPDGTPIVFVHGLGGSHLNWCLIGPRLAEGMVLAIEPMVNYGKPDARVLGDKWTAVTVDGSFSAHFEHCVAVTKDGPVILTQ